MKSTFVDDHAPFGVDHDSVGREVRRRIRQRLPAVTGACPWLERAQRALAAGDYHAAAVAARRACEEATEATPEALGALARADAGLGRPEDAVVAARRAVELAPGDAGYLLMLAGIFAELRNWGAALRMYAAADRLGTDTRAARTGMASVLLNLGDGSRARRLVEAAYAQGVDSPATGDDLALALAEVAEKVPAVRDTDAYFITDPKEIDQMRSLLDRADWVARDPELAAGIRRIRSYVDECARRVLVSARLSEGPAVCAWLGLAVAVAVAAAGLRLGTGPLVAGGVAGALVALAGLVRRGWVPRWKLNRLAFAASREGSAE